MRAHFGLPFSVHQVDVVLGVRRAGVVPWAHLGAIKVGRHAGSWDINHSQPRLEGRKGIPVSSLDRSTGVKEKLYQSQFWAPVNLGRLLLLIEETEAPEAQWLMDASHTALPWRT